MAISYSQIASARRPEPAVAVDELRPTRPSHFLIRAVSGVANMIGRWYAVQVTIPDGASDKAVARAARGGSDHYDTVKWNLFARHYGARQVH